LSNKYKKAMDEIVMSDELKAKILDKAMSTIPEKKKIPFIYSRKYIGMAACLVVCAVFAYFVSGNLSMNDIKIKDADKPQIEHKTDVVEKDVVPEVNNTTEEITKQPKTEETVSPKNNVVQNIKPQVEEDYGKSAKTEDEVAEETPVVENSIMDEATVGGGGAAAARMMPEETVEETVEEAVVTEEEVEEAFDESVAAYNPMEKVSGIAEIEEKLGIDIKAPQILDSWYEIESCYIIGGTLAEINYVSDSNDFTYRTEKGLNDISGDYNVYENTEQILVDDMTVTVKGTDGQLNRADWNDGEYSYSIGCEKGMDLKETISIIKGIK